MIRMVTACRTNLWLAKAPVGEIFPVTLSPKLLNIFVSIRSQAKCKWVNPVLQGEYNVAFLTEEWRRGYHDRLCTPRYANYHCQL